MYLSFFFLLFSLSMLIVFYQSLVSMYFYGRHSHFRAAIGPIIIGRQNKRRRVTDWRDYRS